MIIIGFIVWKRELARNETLPFKLVLYSTLYTSLLKINREKILKVIAFQVFQLFAIAVERESLKFKKHRGSEIR